MARPSKYLLVDGHSFLFTIPSWRRLHEQNRTSAREKLIRSLQDFHDDTDWLVTLVFDGTVGIKQMASRDQIAVLYSLSHSTADSIIEKIVSANRNPEQITVVTADMAEQRLVESFGAFCMSPEWLQGELECSSQNRAIELRRINHKSKW
ncbi:MAG: NYN domain-containing protein [Candidatus Methylacidiphilales bacterium]